MTSQRSGSTRAPDRAAVVRRGLAQALCVGLALSGVRCVQDLVSPPQRSVYLLEVIPPQAQSYTVNIGDTIPIPSVRLTVDGREATVRFVATVTAGSGTVMDTLPGGGGSLVVRGLGNAVVDVRALSTAIVSDTALHLAFQLHASVPRLASSGPDTLYSLNDSATLRPSSHSRGRPCR